MSYEVQHYNFRDGWTNTWLRHIPGRAVGREIFATRAEAEGELDSFFEEIAFQIADGERHPDDGYHRDEYRVAKVGER
ncbi:hypothetical protein [Acidimangrovimonas pyrenivorans]|uniref:Uncharacterized protein n=1 Tax=Acidimangrovimonas pyrenivorans TaxID=2030798 RepID=A0ABV7ACB3_9RHOB